MSGRLLVLMIDSPTAIHPPAHISGRLNSKANNTRSQRIRTKCQSRDQPTDLIAAEIPVAVEVFQVSSTPSRKKPNKRLKPQRCKFWDPFPQVVPGAVAFVQKNGDHIVTSSKQRKQGNDRIFSA